MSVRSRAVRSITVLEVSGSFFGDEETDQLAEAIANAEAAGNTRLVLDLANCKMMNSTTLGVLAKAQKSYLSRQGVIKISGLQKRMENALVVSRLITLFDHYDTVDEALASFVEAEPAR